MNKDWFPQMVQASNVDLREGTDKLLSELNAAGVPVLILSAGLGDLAGGDGAVSFAWVGTVGVHIGQIVEDVETT